MKRSALVSLVSLFVLIPACLFGVGEKIISMGAESAWKDVEIRSGIAELPSLRPYPVLILSSARTGTALTGTGSAPVMMSGDTGAGGGNLVLPDLALSFDEGRPDRFKDRAGHYRIAASPRVSVADQDMSRAGAGAVFFTGNGSGEFRGLLRDSGPLTITPEAPEALLSADRNIRDFSLEFWLYPLNMETGEQILSWSSNRRIGREHFTQRIRCEAAGSRLRWSFEDFFAGPGGNRRLTVTLKGAGSVTPRTWTHHLIRFDADTGLLEYLVNGGLEDIRHVTPSGREGDEVYTPRTGQEGVLVLGEQFRGLMDELMIYGAYIETPLLQKYPSGGGRIETRLLDMGEGNSEILRVEACGGRASLGARGFGGIVRNEYAGTGNFNFSDDSTLRFFIRTGETPRGLSGSEWTPVKTGTELPGNLRGRFVQLAVQFYPSGDGETAPYLEALRIVYRPDFPPGPPPMVTAIARDGAVDLSWKGSPDPDTAGYLVYYGLSRGEYFGAAAAEGASPINVGNRTSVRITGLQNGVLYYFALSAFDRTDPLHGGEFSREVSARPLRAAE